MRMSLMIKSGTDCASLTSASGPLRAIVISNPSAPRNTSSALSRLGSSSTINSRLGILVLLAYPLLVAFRPLRQPNRKSTSLPDCAFHRDPAAQLFDETADHVQAQTHARFHFPVRCPALIKALEDMRQICCTDTATSVLYIYAAFLARGCYSEDDGSVVRRVLDRVFRNRANSSSQGPVIGHEGD